MLRRFQGGRTVRRTHRTARVVAGLLGFSLVCAWSAVAVAGDGDDPPVLRQKGACHHAAQAAAGSENCDGFHDRLLCLIG